MAARKSNVVALRDRVDSPGLRMFVPERHWWGSVMDDDTYIRLIREIEVERGRVTAHELVCAERYKGIHDTLALQNEKLDKLVTGIAQSSGKTNRWVISALTALVTLLLGLLGWGLTQVYDLQPARVVYTQSHK